MGIVYAPALDRLFHTKDGERPVEITGGGRKQLSVRPLPPEGAIAVASYSHRDSETDTWLINHGITETTAIGSSLKFCLVAAGAADVYPRFGPTMEWDTAAGDAVLRAAGGRTETPNGAEFTYGKADYRNGAFSACGGFCTIRPAS